MTNRFLAGLIALAFCLIIALPAHAQEAISPEKQDLIKELMRLQSSSNSEALIDVFLDHGLKQVAPMISQALLQEYLENKQRLDDEKQVKTGEKETTHGRPPLILPPDEEKRLKSQADEATQRIIAHIRAEFPKRVNMTELRERVGVEIYAKHFSEDE